MSADDASFSLISLTLAIWLFGYLDIWLFAVCFICGCCRLLLGLLLVPLDSSGVVLELKKCVCRQIDTERQTM